MSHPIQLQIFTPYTQSFTALRTSHLCFTFEDPEKPIDNVELQNHCFQTTVE